MVHFSSSVAVIVLLGLTSVSAGTVPRGGPNLGGIIGGLFPPQHKQPPPPQPTEGPEDGDTQCPVYNSKAACASHKNCFCAQDAGGPAAQCVEYGPSKGPCNFNKDPDFCGAGQQCIINSQGGYQCAVICK